MSSFKRRLKSICSTKWLCDDTCSLGLTLMVALLCFCILPTNGQQSIGPDTQQGRQLSLKQQLTLGLKAVTPSDKEFIDLVVLRVEQGKLPRSLVDSTFLWARQRADAKSYSRSLRPMVYFKPGLIARTKKLHIEL
ncbi:hypothetical protein [Bythopirellula goksoeyrii]|nr:hypothetical protein [Bythopirellula goksoeyrii]